MGFKHLEFDITVSRVEVLRDAILELLKNELGQPVGNGYGLDLDFEWFGFCFLLYLSEWNLVFLVGSNMFFSVGLHGVADGWVLFVKSCAICSVRSKICIVIISWLASN